MIGSSRTGGFSLVETLVATAVFLLMAVSIYQTYQGLLALVSLTRAKTIAAALGNEIFEIAHNLPYADVGVPQGVPAGKLPHTQTISRDGINFLATTTVRTIDDPFDGTIGGNPNDTAPSDYKLVEVEIGCPTCRFFQPLVVSGRIAPKNLEGASTNGALFVKVFDGNGVAVPDASVVVTNSLGTINITDTTNTSGVLQLLDIPPGGSAYRISVSKSGYSSERTYLPGDPANPNPSKPDATIIAQQVTQVSFAIDKISSLSVQSVRDTCLAVGDLDFSVSGAKVIGTNPDVLKYSANKATSALGVLAISGLEWDTYGITLTDSAYDLLGTIPTNPFLLLPNSNQTLSLVVTPTNPKALLVTVTDAASGLPVTDASVSINLSSATTTLVTGRGFFGQTSWLGGANQESMADETKFFSSDGNIEYTTVPGDLRLKQILGQYQASGELISSTIDLGAATNFYQLLVTPGDQPPQAGSNSVRLQIATNDDGATWNFKGPDGTAGTYYTPTNQSIHSSHSGNRYLRYKIFLTTDSGSYTPNVSNIAFTFTAGCVPPGQVMFPGLSSATYNLTISKVGYQDYLDTVSVSASETAKAVVLQPE